MAKNRKGLLEGFWRLARPYWVSENRWKARAHLALVVALSLASVFMFVELNTWNGLLFDALQHFDKSRLLPLTGRFAIILIGIIGIGVYTQYLTQLLQIKWREWMTQEMLGRWLEHRTFYFMQISEAPLENPDQRMAEDIKEFIDLTLGLSLGLIRQIVTLFSFVGILWKFSGTLNFSLGGILFEIPGYLAFASVIYAALGSWVTHKIGGDLVKINYNQQRYEADFRFSLVRVRENSESIALSSGEKAEKNYVLKKFGSIITNFRDLISKQKQLGFFTALFNNASALVPLMLVTPRYFSKAIELGACMQTINAFGRVENALSWFVINYVEWSHWRAVVQRLEGFDDCMSKTESLRNQVRGLVQKQADQKSVSINSLTLQLPSNKELLRDIHFTIPKGRAVLLHGPSGCGKSTLLRAISGVWPFAIGNISLPLNEQCMVIPQKSYLPVDTLRAAIYYPVSPELNSDAEVKSLLKLCRLEHLESSLGEVQNWAQILSPGEQQRIAFLRVFLQKPEWLFLDEATSALDEETQAVLYRAIVQRLPGVTIVSIAHRDSLLNFHDLHFDVSKRHWTKAA